MRAKKKSVTEDLRPEYKFTYSDAERGKYHQRLSKEGANVVILEPDVAKAFHPISHDLGGHGRFLRHRQVTRAGAEDGDDAGSLCERSFLDGQAAGGFVVRRMFEFPADLADVVLGDPSD